MAAPAFAAPLNLPVGIQLYSVGDSLRRDFMGTLKALAAMGYREVELADTLGKFPAEWRNAFVETGLICRSAHYGVHQLDADVDKTIGFARELGLAYMICAFPRLADVANATLDEWRWHADFFNRVGARVKAAGMQFGYHNHNIEFRTYNGVTGLDEIIRLTDSALVKIQLDCGWAATAGHDPAALLLKHPGRFSLLHVKDLKPGFAINTDLRIETTEVGRGVLDWRKIFAAARTAGVAGYYVELEPPHALPPLARARISHDYLDGLTP